MTTEPNRLPPFSISQVSTLAASFGDDVRAYAAAGVDGIGIWELKLAEGSDAAGARGARRERARPRLGRAGGAVDPAAAAPARAPTTRRSGSPRSARRCTGSPRSGRPPSSASPAPRAASTPTLPAPSSSTGCAPSPRRPSGPACALALEPYQRDGIEDWSIANTLADGAALIADAGGSPALGLQFDVWHQWNTPDLAGEIARHAHLIAGVHVCDQRDPTRGWADRALPGDGDADVPADPRRARRGRLGRLLRSRDLLRQRRLRQRVSRLALGCRRRRARAPRSGAIRPLLGKTEGRGYEPRS